MPTAGWFCQLIHNLCFALSRIRCTRQVSAMADAFFLVFCGSCWRRWVSANTAWFLRICLLNSNPDPIPRWELGACHSHTPHCCPHPWREIWVTGVEGAALFLDWVWALTDHQGPREIWDISSVQSLWENWVEEPKVQIFKSTSGSERSQKPHPEIDHVLQHPDLHCDLSDLGCAMWHWQCDLALGLLVVGQQSPACAMWAAAPRPCLDLEARWILRDVHIWDVSSSAHENREGLPWQLFSLECFSSVFQSYSVFLISLVFNLSPFLTGVQRSNWSEFSD